MRVDVSRQLSLGGFGYDAARALKCALLNFESTQTNFWKSHSFIFKKLKFGFFWAETFSIEFSTKKLSGDENQLEKSVNI
jgi:hypothetical protein